MESQLCGIYKIVNTITGQVYIGQSTNIERRWQEHKRPYKRNNPTNKLYQAFNDYGLENFNFEVIEECPQSLLNERELYWINYFDAFNNGYNMSRIENLQHKLSIEEVQKIQNEIIYSSKSFSELAEEFDISHTWLSLVNKGEMWYNSKLSYPLREPKRYSKNYCLDCGKKISSVSTRCSICASKAARFCDRPNREELKQLIRNKTFVEIGKLYGGYR